MSVAFARNSLFVTMLASSCCLADSVHVAMNGVDSASCGLEATPCRTITQGISNAPVGGTVLVHPGLYGDLIANQQLGDAGEEPGTPSAVISIGKSVTVLSSDGAAVTTIDANHSKDTVVEIASSDVTFGGEGAGFTLTNGNAAGVQAFGSNVTIRNNVAMNNGNGGFRIFASGVIHLRGNSAVGNSVEGFHIAGFSSAGYVVLRNNNAVSNGGEGFALIGATSPHRLIANAAAANTNGIRITAGPFVVRGNTFSGNNTGILFDSDANSAVVSRNNIVGSRVQGVLLLQTAASIQLHENNIYGTANTFGDPFNACGLTNLQGALADASNNYWGAATGPGPKPADNLCGNPVVSTPFATQPFDVTAN